MITTSLDTFSFLSSTTARGRRVRIGWGTWGGRWAPWHCRAPGSGASLLPPAFCPLAPPPSPPTCWCSHPPGCWLSLSPSPWTGNNTTATIYWASRDASMVFTCQWKDVAATSVNKRRYSHPKGAEDGMGCPAIKHGSYHPAVCPEGPQDEKAQDTGPRELRCTLKGWFQWAQTLASPHTYVYVCVLVTSHSLFVTPWTVAHQVPLSIEFSRH